jgi:TolA-binding protein
MLRHLSRTTGLLAVASMFAVPGVVGAQADTRPVVVVFSFSNNAIGKDAAEYEGMSKGVQDLLITDLASNTKIRLVDRARLQDLLTEQNLSKNGVVDQSTAVRLGHMLGAQYAITGGFITDGKSQTRLDSHVIDMETSQINNPQTVTGKVDDLLGLISQLSGKVNGSLNLAPKPGAPRKSEGDGANSGAAQSAAPTASPAAKAAVATENYAKPLAKPDAMKSTKLDLATMKIYSNALDELDKKNTTKARQLFQQVVDKYPGFEPAQRNLEKLQAKAAN